MWTTPERCLELNLNSRSRRARTKNKGQTSGKEKNLEQRPVEERQDDLTRSFRDVLNISEYLEYLNILNIL